jgi:hypothetical protein
VRPRLEAAVAPVVRRAFLRSFLRGCDRMAALGAIPSAVAHRLTDPNMGERERERMRAMARWAGARA